MAVLYSAPHHPVGLWLDSASPVEMTGVRSLSGHCPVKVQSKSGQSLLKSENSLSGQTPVDFDQTMTGLFDSKTAWYAETN